MADLETTQAKLRSTPTAGVSGEHSAYYRRLLSAGYKGYIQGSIGGGALYGSIGLGIGAVVGIPLAIFATGGAALAGLYLIPAMGLGLGLYGAHTFADIGKTAAIIADSADTNEKRRYLLDRYYETPNDLEAAEIKRQLESANEPGKPAEPFHWRPALIGAAIGLVLMTTAVLMLMHGMAPDFLVHAFDAVGANLGLTFTPTGIFSSAELAAAAGSNIAPQALGLSNTVLPTLIGVLGSIGAMAGAVIGIDREFIRRWLDRAEFAVHDVQHNSKGIATREQEVQRLAEAARRGETLVTRIQESNEAAQKIQVANDPAQPVRNITPPALERVRPAPVLADNGLDAERPSTTVSSVREHQGPAASAALRLA